MPGLGRSRRFSVWCGCSLGRASKTSEPAPARSTEPRDIPPIPEVMPHVAASRIAVVEKVLAESLARRLGLAFDEAEIIGRGMNVLVHLRPAPVVARVTRRAHLVRPVDTLTGGIGLARHLGEHAVPPSALIDPGPHVEGGRYITFWTYRHGVEA